MEFMQMRSAYCALEENFNNLEAKWKDQENNYEIKLQQEHEIREQITSERMQIETEKVELESKFQESEKEI